jgi:tetratricopeptide (TPR) repeat protein
MKSQKYTVLFIVLLLIKPVFASPESFEIAVKNFDANKLASASEQFTALKSEPQWQMVSQFYLARIALKQQQFDSALALLEATTLKDEDAVKPAQYHYWLGVTNAKLASNSSWFKAPGYASDAKANFERAVELAPDFNLARKGLFRYYLRAPGIAGGSIKKAKQQIAAVRALSELDAALLQLELAQYEDNKALILDSAEQLFAFKDSPEALYQAGLAFQQTQSYEKAFLAFRLAYSFLPSGHLTETSSYTQLAAYQFSKTAVLAELHLPEAIKAMQAYLTMPIEKGMPEKSWAQFRLGQLYWLSGDKTQAKRLFGEIKHAQQDPQLVKALKQFLK